MEVSVQCHNSARPCIWVLVVSTLLLFLRLCDRILKLFWWCGILLFSYCNSATRHPWKVEVFHTMKKYLYISHYRHIEGDIDHIEIIWNIFHAPLTSDTTTVYLRGKSRLTNENDIMLNLLTLQSKGKDRRYQKKNQTDNTMAKRYQKP